MNNINKLLTLTTSVKKKATKLNKFTSTYIRCFDPADQKKLLRSNHVGRFTFSLLIGPVPFVASYYFPYTLVYPEFFAESLVYTFPVYALVYFATRELFGNLFIRKQLRYKEKLYKKYYIEMDLTKEQVKELELEEESKLKLEGKELKEKSKENKEETITFRVRSEVYREKSDLILEELLMKKQEK